MIMIDIYNNTEFEWKIKITLVKEYYLIII